MVRKKGFICIIILAIALLSLSGFFFLDKKEPIAENLEEKKEVQKPIQTVKKTAPKKIETEEKIFDLYTTTPYDLPLFSVLEIAKLPQNIKNSVDNLLEKSQGFYFLKVIDDKVFIILQNPVLENNTYTRHNLQFIEISFDGKINYHTAGYSGIADEIYNSQTNEFDNWIFLEDSVQTKPLKHTSFDEKGNIKFIEVWNYDENEPIKYEMKDSKKNLISILKESQDSDMNLRREHVFYDNNGQTIMSFTVNYDGANISRIMFYNSHEAVDGFSLISEFQNGIKTKEQIYNKDYQLTNIVIPEYEDDTKKSIKLLDSEGNEVFKISA